MSESRQLSAILFADIVGFSALMQSDEKRALVLRHKLKEDLEATVQLHNGRIIKWMGDGVLCTFNSAIPVSYTHLRAPATVLGIVCRLLLSKKKAQTTHNTSTHIY